MTSSQWDTHGCSRIKHFQVQTVARALLCRWGTRRHFRCLSNPFSAPQYWVSFWQGQREICSLCSGSDTDGVHFKGEILPQVLILTLFQECVSVWCCNLFFLLPLSINLPHFNLIHCTISLNTFPPFALTTTALAALHSGQSVEELVVLCCWKYFDTASCY